MCMIFGNIVVMHITKVVMHKGDRGYYGVGGLKGG